MFLRKRDRVGEDEGLSESIAINPVQLDSSGGHWVHDGDCGVHSFGV